MKRVLVCFISFILIVTGFSFTKPVYALQDFHMDIYPRKAGTKATYKFIVTIEKAIHVHDYIKLGFPQGTKIDKPRPGDSENPLFGMMLEYYQDGSLKSLKFTSRIEIDPSLEGYSTITVTVPDIAGIILPEKPGWYPYRFSTQAEPEEIRVQTEIVESKLGNPTGKPEVHVYAPTPGIVASYKIGFNVGRGGFLNDSVGIIKIKFPKETTLSKVDIPTNAIMINGKPLDLKSLVSKDQISFTTPIVVADSGRVEVEITDRAGIINPSKPGTYTLDVSTTADNEWVTSYQYEIIETPLLLKLSNYRINQNAIYQLIYNQMDSVTEQNGLIRIRFPEEVQITKSLSLGSGKITINSQSVTEIHEIESHVYDIRTNTIAFNLGEPLDIVFDCPEIKNPVDPCYIHIACQLPGMKDYINSPFVAIVPFSMTLVKIEVSPPNIRENATFTIQLLFGKIDFTTISVYFGHSNITKEIQNYEIKTDISTITLHDINTGNQPGEFQLRIFTDLETDGATGSYVLLPPTPSTKISHKGKRGLNKWWLSSPEITLTSSDPEAEILYWWNDQNATKNLYIGPIRYGEISSDPNPKPDPSPLLPGYFKARLYYQSRNANGLEHPKTEEIWVDTVNPEIVIETPLESKLLLNQRQYTISGHQTFVKIIEYGQERLIFDAIITMNNDNIETDKETGFFSKEVELQEGENHFKIHAEDEAGNIWDAERIITLDTMKPDIMILPREVLDPTLSGKTDPTALLSVNGEIVYVKEDGSFQVDLKGVGLHTLLIIATDPVGNRNEVQEMIWYGYTIILQVGSQKASNNDKVLLLNVTPLIQKSKTLVPFRFIGEQLNATITYSTDPIRPN